MLSLGGFQLEGVGGTKTKKNVFHKRLGKYFIKKKKREEKEKEKENKEIV